MTIKPRTQETFKTRMARFSDLDAAVDLINAHSQRLFGTTPVTAKDLNSEWTLENYSPETHIRLAEDDQGKLAGYIEFWDMNQPRVIMNTWLRVHPDYPTAEVAPALLAWSEAQAIQRLPTAPEGTRVVLRIGALIKDRDQVAALEKADYQKVRRFWRMRIDFNGAVSVPVWPDGIQVRSMQPGEERKAIEALRAAFHDHWGHVDVPFEDEFKRWQHFMSTGDWFNPSLWFFAMDGEDIAGFSFCRASLDGEPDLGWVGQLGVLRPWRNHGLGLALLQHSFVELQRLGQPSVGLGVDSSSLTGATRLYEKAGMRPDERYTIDLYEKELRPGVDITTH